MGIGADDVRVVFNSYVNVMTIFPSGGCGGGRGGLWPHPPLPNCLRRAGGRCGGICSPYSGAVIIELCGGGRGGLWPHPPRIRRQSSGRCGGTGGLCSTHSSTRSIRHLHGVRTFTTGGGGSGGASSTHLAPHLATIGRSMPRTRAMVGMPLASQWIGCKYVHPTFTRPGAYARVTR